MLLDRHDGVLHMDAEDEDSFENCWPGHGEDKGPDQFIDSVRVTKLP